MLGYKQREPGEEGGKRRSERKRRKAQRCGCCAPASLRGRVLALQRHLAVLQTVRCDAQRSSQELRDANEKITSQLAQRLNVSKQLSQVPQTRRGEDRHRESGTNRREGGVGKDKQGVGTVTGNEEVVLFLSSFVSSCLFFCLSVCFWGPYPWLQWEQLLCPYHA